MDQHQFQIDVNPDNRDVEYLKDRIDTFNVDETKIYDFKELAIFLRDSAGLMNRWNLRAYLGRLSRYQILVGTGGFPRSRAWIETDACSRARSNCQRLRHRHA
jgi:hypothetical protein